MASKRHYKTRAGYRRGVKAIRRGIKSGKYERPSCSTFRRRYCFTKRGKPVRCGLYGAQYKSKTHTSSRCRSKLTGQFKLSQFCKRSCK
jgi:hypothetical protein